MSRSPARTDLARELLELATFGRDAAWLLLDDDGRLLRAGGELAAHALDGLRIGDDATRALPMLVGCLPPPSEGLHLPAVSAGSGRPLDVALRALDDGVLVLLLEARTELDLLSAMQQSNHDAELAMAATLRRLVPLQGALAGLGLRVLLRDADGALCALTPAPRWLSSARAHDAPPGARLSRQELTPFLDHFLGDAEAIWTADGAGRLRSGPWTEQDGPRERALEAEALRLPDGTCVLLVAEVDATFREQRDVLQAARASKLEYDRLRREIEQKELLLHCIVHDLNGPLATILGSLSMLHKRHADDARSTRLVEMGLEQARRQESRIRQVLDVFSAEIASMQGFSTDPEHAPDAAAAAARVARTLQPAFQHKGVRLRLLPDPLDARRSRVVGDADRLERVLENLLENALRHSSRDQAVTLALRDDGHEVVITVEDQGPGVAPEMADTLFEKFGRARHGGGAAGLGLFFCRYTVLSWGGSIVHEAVRPHGARFVVRLPRPRARDAGRPATSP
ncbi:MAG: HAMP domain-containing histidine kinase [Planctomycetes bacterium]|nr:HAMP domain-containing histidine kinase [Planctomycetota bacterium]